MSSKTTIRELIQKESQPAPLTLDRRYSLMLRGEPDPETLTLEQIAELKEMYADDEGFVQRMTELEQMLKNE